MKPLNFEQWWKQKYAGKLGSPIIEASFKKLAENAWKQAVYTSDNAPRD